jgi:hypothetical protein
VTSEKTFRYISFGAGVQSTALLVMSVLGLKNCPKADVAIFADTCGEPAWVIDNVNFYRLWAYARGVDVVTISKGNLEEDLLTAGDGGRFVSIPMFTEGDDGRASLMHRECTREFKIEPIAKDVRKLLGILPRRKIRFEIQAMIGISLDETIRMKPNRLNWIKNTWPLIDARMTRNDCEALLQEQGLPVPRKSSCVFCPYHSDAYWQDLKVNHPTEFARAVAVDEAIRNSTKKGIERPAYLHRSLKPLIQIDFSRGQRLLDGFGNECEGHCGV